MGVIAGVIWAVLALVFFGCVGYLAENYQRAIKGESSKIPSFIAGSMALSWIVGVIYGLALAGIIYLF